MSGPDQGHTDTGQLQCGYDRASDMCGVHMPRVRHTAPGTTSTHGGRPPQVVAHHMTSYANGVHKSTVHQRVSQHMAHTVRHGTVVHMCGDRTPGFFRMGSRRIYGRPFFLAIESTERAYMIPCHRSTLLRLLQRRAGTVQDDICRLGNHAACTHVYICHHRNAALHEVADADSIRGGTSTCTSGARHA